MKSWIRLIPGLLAISLGTLAFASHSNHHRDLRYIKVPAKNKFERSRIANTGMTIEFVRSDAVWGFALPGDLKKLKAAGIPILENLDPKLARGGHSVLGFPQRDENYHDYAEMMTAIQNLYNDHNDIMTVSSIGNTHEGRNIWAIHINTTPSELASGKSNKPGAMFFGTHHAREHLSTEVPLMLAQYLLKNRNQERIAKLLSSRDIWIVPMVNPDGVEWDIASGTGYKMWRKNRKLNSNNTYGVDLNRNYGYQWGTGGSSSNPSSDVYMGESPFSEPETQAVKKFVEDNLNTTVMISFHTFSELILYPWGHKNGSIENRKDREVFETMARKMATWNGYKPQQSSDLYIASGDTTDWAYGEHGIFAFTFELSPA